MKTIIHVFLLISSMSSNFTFSMNFQFKVHEKGSQSLFYKERLVYWHNPLLYKGIMIKMHQDSKTNPFDII